jgi:hypothetical protein
VESLDFPYIFKNKIPGEGNIVNSLKKNGVKKLKVIFTCGMWVHVYIDAS